MSSFFNRSNQNNNVNNSDYQTNVKKNVYSPTFNHKSQPGGLISNYTYSEKGITTDITTTTTTLRISTVSGSSGTQGPAGSAGSIGHQGFQGPAGSGGGSSFTLDSVTDNLPDYYTPFTVINYSRKTLTLYIQRNGSNGSPIILAAQPQGPLSGGSSTQVQLIPGDSVLISTTSTFDFKSRFGLGESSFSLNSVAQEVFDFSDMDTFNNTFGVNYINIYDLQAWKLKVSDMSCVFASSGQQNGLVSGTTLQLVSEADNTILNEKSNDPSDPDFIQPYNDTNQCPLSDFSIRNHSTNSVINSGYGYVLPSFDYINISNKPGDFAVKTATGTTGFGSYTVTIWNYMTQDVYDGLPWYQNTNLTTAIQTTINGTSSSPNSNSYNGLAYQSVYNIDGRSVPLSMYISDIPSSTSNFTVNNPNQLVYSMVFYAAGSGGQNNGSPVLYHPDTYTYSTISKYLGWIDPSQEVLINFYNQTSSAYNIDINGTTTPVNGNNILYNFDNISFPLTITLSIIPPL